jgi:hypothetical protein
MKENIKNSTSFENSRDKARGKNIKCLGVSQPLAYEKVF